MIKNKQDGEWCNGSTSPLGGFSSGSNPDSPT